MLKQKWKSIRQMSWQQILVNGICLCIIFAGIVVSIQMNLVGRALWYDESALAFSFCQRSLSELTASELDYVQSAPVGWLYLLKIFSMIFGYSTYALRTPSIIAYVGTIFFLYRILKDIFHVYYAMAGPAFAASLPLILQYSNVFKPYISDCFCCLLAIWIYYRWFERKKGAIWVGAFWAVLIWFSNPVVFVEAGMILSAGILGLKNRTPDTIKKLFVTGIMIVFSFAIYYFYWLRQTAVENESMLGYWQDYNFPLIPTSLDEVKQAVQLTGLLFQPFYRLQYIVMILLAAFAVWTVLKKDLYFIGIYLSFFVAAVASYLDKYPINKRLWLFIYPLITIILFAGLDDFIQKKNKKHTSVYTVGIIMLGICVLNSGIRYYAKEENVYWPGYEVGKEYDYLLDHIEDEWVYVYNPIIPEFAYINNYNEEYLEGTEYKVVLGSTPLGAEYDCQEDLDLIFGSDACYIFMSDSWDNEYLSGELFAQGHAKGHLEMVYNDYITPLWRYCSNIEDVKARVDYQILETLDERESTIYTIQIKNTGESYLNTKFETTAFVCDTLGFSYELPEDMAPGTACQVQVSLPKGTRAEFTVSNEYGQICPNAQLVLEN